MVNTGCVPSTVRCHIHHVPISWEWDVLLIYMPKKTVNQQLVSCKIIKYTTLFEHCLHSTLYTFLQWNIHKLIDINQQMKTTFICKCLVYAIYWTIFFRY